MQPRGFFVSDLHLLSRRSIGQARWDAWKNELNHSTHLVLGGDIFDFRWSLHSSVRESLTEIAAWLEILLKEFPHLQVSYVLGNHDCLPAMKQLLDEIRLGYDRFQWDEFYLRLDDMIFLHGDVLDAKSPATLVDYRKKFEEHHPRGPMANHLYDWLIASRLHQLPPKIRHTPARTSQKLSDYLASHQLRIEDGISKIFFGHTHLAIDGANFRGQSFFNPGSGIKHQPFAPKLFLPREARSKQES